jgi:hypothetical protein
VVGSLPTTSELELAESHAEIDLGQAEPAVAP